MDRTEKKDSVAWIDSVFAANEVVVVLKNTGLSVSDMTDLRSRLRETGAGMKVVKNRLAKIAIADKPGEKISNLFQGPTAIAFSADPVSAPKVLAKYAKENEKLVILGGMMGDESLDEGGVKALANMPSREDILASIAGMLMAPAQNLAGAISAPAANIASILKTLEERESA